MDVLDLDATPLPQLGEVEPGSGEQARAERQGADQADGLQAGVAKW